MDDIATHEPAGGAQAAGTADLGPEVAAEPVLLLAEAPALELPVWEATGDAEVDAALEGLRLLDDAELTEHVRVFTEVHEALHARLSGIAGGPGA